MSQLHPFAFPVFRFGVRQATAFVGHSFSSEDEEIVSRLTDLFSKLGVVCESGKRAEPSSVSEKVRKRIKDAEFFIAIFTRRGAGREDGTFETSPWVVEEKAIAIAENKRILIFIENGVTEIGGMQGDHEYIRFDRNNFGDALLSAIDYVLTITSVPLRTQIEGNRINISMGTNITPSESLAKLRKAKEDQPRDPSVRVWLAGALEQAGDRPAGLRELEQAKTDFPRVADVHHSLGHAYEASGDLSKAIACYEKSVELSPANAKFKLCYAKALFEKSKNLDKQTRKKAVLDKAKRFLEQGLVSADANIQKDIQNYLFLIEEAARPAE